MRQMTTLEVCSAALDMGKAAEHLVCADLLLNGYQAYLTDQGLPYDVILDTPGRLFRVQVKGTTRIRNMNSQGRAERHGYSFSARRRGKNAGKRLDASHCDIVAFVALDLRMIAYLPLVNVATTVQFSQPDFVFKGKHRRKIGRINEFPIAAALEAFHGN